MRLRIADILLACALLTAMSSCTESDSGDNGGDGTLCESRAVRAVVLSYYRAIEAGDYRDAYLLWGNEGAASGQSFEEFANGFAEMASVAVEVGEPGRIGAAAGSRYVDVPVVIRAETRAGEEQRFEGSYTLRRSVVDGATAASRRWHIYSADIVRKQ